MSKLKTLDIKIVRATIFDKKPVAAGEIFKDVPASDAQALISAKKAKKYIDEEVELDLEAGEDQKQSNDALSDDELLAVENLKPLHVPVLQRLATLVGLTGFKDLKKDELIEFIEKNSDTQGE